MKNILLIGANKKEFAKKFESKDNIKRILIIEEWYKDLYSIEKYEIVKYVKSINDYEEIIKKIEEIKSKIEIESIIAVSERAILTAGFVRNYLGINGMSYDDSLLFTNKYIMKEKFSKLGYCLPCISFEDFKIDTSNKFPLIIKPIYGSAAKGIQKINSFTDFQTKIKLIADKDVIIEPFLKIKKEFHIDSIVINGKVLFYSISEYFTPMLEREHGSFMIGENHKLYKELKSLNENIINHINIQDSYVTHAEFLLDEDYNLYLGEIACRPGGGKIIDLINRVYSIDFDDVVIELSLNNMIGVIERIKQIKNKKYDTRINAWFGLPTKSGMVSSISENTTFLKIKGVFDSKVELKKGDIVNKNFHSSSISGYVLFKGNTIEEVQSIKNKIENNFTLNTINEGENYD